MFQFSSLLNKKNAEEGGRWKTLAFPQSGPASVRDRSVSVGMAAEQCISDRVRRDLDEQMQRLADLLDHVESLDFAREAATSDFLTSDASLPTPEATNERTATANPDRPRDDSNAQTASATHVAAIPDTNTDATKASSLVKPSNPIAESGPISSLAQTSQQPSRCGGACEVILSSGAVKNIAELALKPTSDRPDNNAANANFPAMETMACRTPGTERSSLKPFVAPRQSTNPIQPMLGLVQDYAAPTSQRVKPTNPLAEPDKVIPNLAAQDTPSEKADPVPNTQHGPGISPEYSQAFNSPGLHILLVDESRQACPSARGTVAGDRVVALTAGPTGDQSTAGFRSPRQPRRMAAVQASSPSHQQQRPTAVVRESQSLTMLAVVGGLLTLATLAYIALDLANRL